MTVGGDVATDANAEWEVFGPPGHFFSIIKTSLRIEHTLKVECCPVWKILNFVADEPIPRCKCPRGFAELAVNQVLQRSGMVKQKEDCYYKKRNNIEVHLFCYFVR